MTEGADDLDVDPGGQLARWTQSATSPVVDIWLYTPKGKLPAFSFPIHYGTRHSNLNTTATQTSYPPNSHLSSPGVALSTQHGRIRAPRCTRHGLRSPERAMERHRGQGWHQIELEHLPFVAHGTLSVNPDTKLFLTAWLSRKPRDWLSLLELSTRPSRRRPTHHCSSMSPFLASSPAVLS